MKLAGVRLDDRSLVWAVVPDTLEPHVWDRALVRGDAGESTGTVVVSPDQVFLAPPSADATLLTSNRLPAADPDCSYLPGASMPPLGGELPEGIVVRVNAEAGTATVRGDRGDQEITIKPERHV
ncbi:MAG: hypothetical protein ACRDFS_01285 [Chloroflexota bacterium]